MSLQRQGLRDQGPPGGRRAGLEGRGEACQQGGNAPPPPEPKASEAEGSSPGHQPEWPL